jgi:hypothetical protein
VSLAFHTHSEANVAGLLPLTAAASVPAAMNAAVLLGFILAGWGAYLLIRDLAGDPRAAFLGGLVFALFPQHFEQSLEHVNLASYQAMPFFLLFLGRLARAGGWRNIVLTAACFALNALYAWHNGLLALLPGTALLAFEAVRARRLPAALRDASLAGALALAVLVPFAWPMAREILAGETYYLKPQVGKGVDLAFFFIPAEQHPLWGGTVRRLYEEHRAYGSAGFTCYLGVVALILAAAGLRGRPAAGGRRLAEGSVPFWAALFIVHAVLALGDSLTVLGRDTGFPLPFELIEKIPLLKTVRIANRFLVPAMLALAVLSALGARRVLVALPPRAAGWAFAALAALLALDYLFLPYPLRDLPRPAYIAAARAAPPGILLDIPGGHRARGAEDMFLQTLHGKPIAGGYTSCIPPWVEKRVAEYPFLKLIFEARPEVEVDLEREVPRALDELGVAVAVVHLDRTREAIAARLAASRGSGLERLHNPERGIPERSLTEVRAVLRRLWGDPTYADPQAEVYLRPR